MPSRTERFRSSRSGACNSHIMPIDDLGFSIIKELTLEHAALNYSLPLTVIFFFFYFFLKQVKVICLFLQDLFCLLLPQD